MDPLYPINRDQPHDSCIVLEKMDGNHQLNASLLRSPSENVHLFFHTAPAFRCTIFLYECLSHRRFFSFCPFSNWFLFTCAQGNVYVTWNARRMLQRIITILIGKHFDSLGSALENLFHQHEFREFFSVLLRFDGEKGKNVHQKENNDCNLALWRETKALP